MRCNRTFAIVPLLLLAAAGRAQNPPANAAIELVGLPSVGRASALDDIRLSPSGDNLFEFVASRQGRVPFMGFRTYVQWIENGGVLRYKERIVVAEAGGAYRFALDLLQVEGLSAEKLAISQQLFQNHAGFLHTYRDFRVLDAKAASANYTVTSLGSFVRAGQTLRVFDVRPRQLGLSSYRITIGDQGVVLDQAEFDPNGRILSAVLYASIQYGNPPLTPEIVLWRPWMESRPHASLVDASRLLDFGPKVPKAVGQGFELLQVRTTKHPGDGKTYLVLVYSDGIDSRFVVESKSGNKLSVDVTPKERGMALIERFRIGPATQYRVDIDGRDILVLGQFHESGIPSLLMALTQ
jgi:hypothetical protein